MIDEPVHLEPWQPEWEIAFRREYDRIAAILDAAIEHIGSTAVPGLVAKPVIDLMIGVERVPPPDRWFDALAGLGYESLGEAGVPGRWYFRIRSKPFRNVHVVERDGLHWINNLALRDYLRRSPAAARRYEAVKQEAVRAGAATLLAYSQAKGPVIESLLQEALKDGMQSA